MDKTIKSKRDLELVTSHSSGYKTSSEKSLFLLITYYLTKLDEIIESGFWVIPKIISASLCKPIHDIINYSTSICPFESGECGKEGKKQKIEYLENEKSFLDEITRWNIFHSFGRGIIWWKNKNLIKK